MPTASRLSLTITGMPNNGQLGRRIAGHERASSRRASSSALGFTLMIELMQRALLVVSLDAREMALDDFDDAQAFVLIGGVELRDRDLFDRLGGGGLPRRDHEGRQQ